MGAEEVLDRRRRPGRKRCPEGLDFIQRRYNMNETHDTSVQKSENTGMWYEAKRYTGNQTDKQILKRSTAKEIKQKSEHTMQSVRSTKKSALGVTES